VLDELIPTSSDGLGNERCRLFVDVGSQPRLPLETDGIAEEDR
jgi:hypothetical protein